jgi:hypothetical protein
MVRWSILGGMPAGQFRALVEAHIEPVVVLAGFAEGQWAQERGPKDDPVCSVIFCAAANDYVRRYPRLSDDRPHWGDVPCIDITIEGSMRDGVTRLDVEFVPLGDLLAKAGLHSDSERLPALLALRYPDQDFLQVGGIFSELYRVQS